MTVAESKRLIAKSVVPDRSKGFCGSSDKLILETSSVYLVCEKKGL